MSTEHNRVAMTEANPPGSLSHGGRRQMNNVILHLPPGCGATVRPPCHAQCIVLSGHCDQCGRPASRPHLVKGRAFCSRCCPSCAQGAAPAARLLVRRSV
jgi:hypothetical protein